MPHFPSFDGLNLHYTDDGAGLPVLCLAGLTRNGHDFDYVAPHLGDVRLIRLDYRGRGGSDWADPATYTPGIEGRDALDLLDHLGLEQAAILGTSRGGLISMILAATAKQRLLGVCLNDIGPVVEPVGLDVIRGYIGKNPVARSMEDLAMARKRLMVGFDNVPDSRWQQEVDLHFIDTGSGITINYDPDLAKIFDTADPAAAPAPADFWPFFDALSDLPIALIRGANSNLLSPETAAEMQRRRPDMGFAQVPDRGHVPFLDEPQAVAAIRDWIGKMQ